MGDKLKPMVKVEEKDYSLLYEISTLNIPVVQKKEVKEMTQKKTTSTSTATTSPVTAKVPIPKAKAKVKAPVKKTNIAVIAGSFIIEKGLPIPQRTKYPFEDMEVGDSFPVGNPGTVRSALQAKKKKDGFKGKFLIGRDDKGKYHCWRTE